MITMMLWINLSFVHAIQSVDFHLVSNLLVGTVRCTINTSLATTLLHLGDEDVVEVALEADALEVLPPEAKAWLGVAIGLLGCQLDIFIP